MATLQLLLLFCVAALASGVPTADEQRHHRGPKDLSDHEHYDGTDHNAEYDHEAFLGKDEAKRFSELPPEEARRRLGVIVDKIDKDRDGQVTEDELKAWVQHVSQRYIYDDVNRLWDHYNRDGDKHVPWQEYRDSHYGKINDSMMSGCSNEAQSSSSASENSTQDPDKIYDTYRQLSYKDAVARDERRYKAADTDGNGQLSREEFPAFLHPQGFKHMRDIVIDETMYEMDKDKDGYVTLEEYMDDIRPRYEQAGAAEGEEPDWVKTEQEAFQNHRDKDSNGKLDKREIGDWLLPQDYDQTETEARHLIHEADVNKDGQLSKDEILQHQDLFVGSQATEYGEYLVRHDEF